MVTGLKRSFNVTSTGGKYKVLGVKESSDPTIKCNGVLFKIHHEEEMANLLRREKNYTPKLIDPKRILFEYKKQFVFKPADRVICFFPQAKHVLLKKNRQTERNKTNIFKPLFGGSRWTRQWLFTGF